MLLVIPRISAGGLARLLCLIGLVGLVGLIGRYLLILIRCRWDAVRIRWCGGWGSPVRD